MKLVFGKDIIDIDGLTVDLTELENKIMFNLFEKIINNLDNIKLEKTNDISPLANKFYEIIDNKIKNNEKDDTALL